VLVIAFSFGSLFEGLHSATETERYVRQKTYVLLKDTTGTLEKVKGRTIPLFSAASNYLALHCSLSINMPSTA